MCILPRMEYRVSRSSNRICYPQSWSIILLQKKRGYVLKICRRENSSIFSECLFKKFPAENILRPEIHRTKLFVAFQQIVGDCEFKMISFFFE